MKNMKCMSLLAVLVFASVPGTLLAQDYFRFVATPERLQQITPPPPEEEERYNFAVGPVRFNVAAGAGLEWNDNITLADHDKKSDLIFRPSVNFDGHWPLSDLNTLRFSLGLSYAKYFSHSEFDSRSILVSPSSTLALTAHVGNIVLTARERFSYQEDPYALPVVSNVATYRRAENTAGLQADWPINDFVNLTVGYEHYNLWAFDDTFKQLSRNVDTIYVRPSYQITPSIRLGVNGSVSFVRFDENIQNDGTSYMVGPFADITLSETTHAFVEVGFQQFDFSGGGTIGDTSSSSTWYAKGEITNQLTEAISQRLIASKTAEVGFGTNFYDLYHVEYGALWKMTPALNFDPSLFYEYYTTSGDGEAEKASRFGAALGLRYALSPTFTLGADYRFLLKSSNLPNSDYTQNLVLLSLYYNF
jgi:predicted porin